jgi:hypothetical protein
MRTVFIGAGEVSIETAKALVKKSHEVIIIETDKAKIDELSEEMDCSFLQGDGSRPDILREVNPEQTDFLFCFQRHCQPRRPLPRIQASRDEHSRCAIRGHLPRVRVEGHDHPIPNDQPLPGGHGRRQ